MLKTCDRLSPLSDLSVGARASRVFNGFEHGALQCKRQGVLSNRREARQVGQWLMWLGRYM
ncbi:hypothetical protein EMIT0P218_20172 [Pseudomonas sp. IT-P218]